MKLFYLNIIIFLLVPQLNCKLEFLIEVLRHGFFFYISLPKLLKKNKEQNKAPHIKFGLLAIFLKKMRYLNNYYLSIYNLIIQINAYWNS